MKFLIIDDRPDDRERIRRTLERDFDQAEFIEIDRREEFERALNRGEFDLVLTENRLPWSTGLEILRAVKSRRPRAPVIMVAGSGSQAIAVQGMKAGLSNYVLKDSLQSLPFAVQESLALARLGREQEQAGERLASSERKFRAVFENASDALFLIERDVCIDCNPAAERLLGCGRERIIQARIEDFSPPTQPDGQPSRDKAASKNRAALAGQPQLFQWQYRRAGGALVATEVNLSRVEIEGRPVVLAVVREISEARHMAEALVESEKTLRQVAETVREVFWIRDTRSRQILYINPAYEELWGRSCQSLYDQPESFLDSVHPEDRDRVVEALQTQRQGEELFDQEYRIVRPDGEVRWVWARTFPVRNDRGDIYRLVGVAEDITPRKQAEAALAETQELLASFVEHTPAEIFISDVAGRMLLVNRAWEQFFGRRREEALGRPVDEIFPPHLAADFMATTRTVIDTAAPLAFERMLPGPDGSAHYFEVIKFPILDPAGGVKGVGGITLDVTGRKQAEAQLLRRNRELDLLNRVIAVSAGALETEVILSTVCRELVLAFDVAVAMASLLDQTRSHIRVAAEYRADSRKPSELNRTVPVSTAMLWQQLQALKQPLAVADIRADPRLSQHRQLIDLHGVAAILVLPLMVEGEMIGNLTLADNKPRQFSDEEIDLAQSVTNQVAGALARVRLAQVQQQLSAAIEEAGETIVITDTAGTIVYVNPAFERITGYSQAEALGQNPRMLKSGRHDEVFYRQLWATLQSGEAWHGHLINRKKDGSLYTEEATISPVYGQGGVIVNYVAVKRDVTRELRREEQLRQAQKMEAVGRLAGGVAHDFNNLLTAISGYTGLLLARFPNPADPIRQDLEQIQKAGERAASLTRQLLAFSRKQVLQPEVIDLNGTVADMDDMLRRLLGEDIDIRTDLAPGLGRVLADRGQLEQVILNLAVNARDAMPGGGRLTIETANVVLDEAYAGQQVEVRPGPYVRLAVSDTGAGMGPEVLSYLFEPFFSTKGQQGTGLGLATVHGIIKQSGGHIDVYSEQGYGTTFNVYLPRLEEDPAVRPQGMAWPAIPGGTETILVVEDEGRVRELVTRALEGRGYTVFAASSPDEALQIGRQEPGPIHLLLTDVIMPGMNGRALAEQLTLIRPKIKVLYMSGYTDSAIIHHGVLEPGVAFIQKPFSLAAIAVKVRETLDK